MPIILSDARARAVVARGSERVKESDAKEREIASHDVGYEESANLRYAKDPPTTARAKRVYTYRPTYLLLLVFFFIPGLREHSSDTKMLLLSTVLGFCGLRGAGWRREIGKRDEDLTIILDD